MQVQADMHTDIERDAVFDALGHPLRRQLFECVRREASTVAGLAARTHVTRSAVSQHLAILLEAGMVDVTDAGRCRIYRARAGALEPLARFLAEGDEGAVPGVDGSVPPTAPRTRSVELSQELGKWQAESPGLDPDALATLVYLLQLGRHILRSSEEAARSVGLRFSDVALLGALRRLGAPYESTPTELSRTFWMTLPGMMKRVVRLEDLGMLERRPNPDDGRGVRLRLTERGLDRLRQLVTHHQPPEYFAIAELPSGERGELARVLATLLAGIDQRHGIHRPPFSVRT